MPITDAFLPSNNSTVTVSVGAGVTHGAFPITPNPSGAVDPPWRSGGEYIEVQNAGAVTVFLETGPGTNVPTTCAVVAAVASSYPILAGQSKIIKRAPGDTNFSVIGAAAGPTTLFMTLGNGI